MKRTLLLLPMLPLLAACVDEDSTGLTEAAYGCVFGDATSLEVGQVGQVESAGTGSFCIDGASGGDFVFIPFLAAERDSARVRVDVTGGGVVAASGGAADVSGILPRLGSAPQLREDRAFHLALRDREKRELEPLMAGGGGPGAADVMPRAASARTAAPEVGDLLELNTSTRCSFPFDIRTGRVAAISDHAIIVVDVDVPAPGLTQQDLEFFADRFDELVFPVNVRNFGQPTDIDDNGRVIIFFTLAVNELTPPGSDFFVGGFFWSGDLFPRTGTQRLQACEGSNLAEMFYVRAPDPQGTVNGNEVSVAFIKRFAVSTIGHEFQHLINASRRIFVNNANTFEQSWLNEGLSHLTEELVFYEAAGVAPGDNLDVADIRSSERIRVAFNEFMIGNIGLYNSYLENPDTASLMGLENLSTRGASWVFLRYALDQQPERDEQTLFDLANSTAAGLTNLRNALGTEPLDLMQDWTVSVFADDAVPGIDRRFTQPSWDFRDIFMELRTDDRFPLRVLDLRSGRPLELRLFPGGAAYPLFGVVEGGRAIVHVGSASSGAAGKLRGSLVRIR